MNSLFYQKIHKNSVNLRLLFLFIVIYFSGLYIKIAFSQEQLSTTQQQLEKISQLVNEIEEKLHESQTSHNAIKKEMVELEREVGRLHQQIDVTKQAIEVSKDEIGRLEKRSVELEQKLNLENEEFRQQIRLAYVSAKQSKWKVLLSQNSLQHVGRNAVIYDFMHRARVEQIEAMKRLTEKVNHNTLAKQQQHEMLQKLLIEQSNAQVGLKKARKEKQAIQAQLSKSIQSSKKQLNKEKAKQNELKKLLKKLTTKQTKGKFSQQKGKLHWPSTGSLKRKFGETRQSSAGIKWNGTLIKADKGTEIKAIYPGKVVFSDWFDHYGWLIIIDHGSGYMSLYAHAEGLYKAVDDEVGQGELIAIVGDSGDIDESGLYFEIRRQGAPVDPASWCTTPKMAYSP